MVDTAHRQSGHYRLAGAAKVIGLIRAELRTMAAPVAAGKPDYADRLSAVLDAMPTGADDCLTAAEIDAITRAGSARGRADGPHRLVMDLTQGTERAAGRPGGRNTHGASVYALTEDDRPRVKVFMAGVTGQRG